MTSNPNHQAFMDELARSKGIAHIKTVDELACAGVFGSDTEVEDFLTSVAEQCHANLA